MYTPRIALTLFVLSAATSIVVDAYLADFDVGSEMEEFIPQDAKKFYDSLNKDDRAVLKRVLSQAASYTNLSSVLTDLKNGSSTLYDKAVSIVTDIRGTVAALSPPARQFLDETVAHVQTALGEATLSFSTLKDVVKQTVQRYQALERTTKDEINSSFPILMGVVDNSVFQVLASGIFGITDVAAAASADAVETTKLPTTSTSSSMST